MAAIFLHWQPSLVWLSDMGDLGVKSVISYDAEFKFGTFGIGQKLPSTSQLNMNTFLRSWLPYGQNLNYNWEMLDHGNSVSTLSERWNSVTKKKKRTVEQVARIPSVCRLAWKAMWGIQWICNVFVFNYLTCIVQPLVLFLGMLANAISSEWF